MTAFEEYREAVAFYHGAAVALYRMPKSDTARIDMDEGERRLDAAVRVLIAEGARRLADSIDYTSAGHRWLEPNGIAAELLPEDT